MIGDQAQAPSLVPNQLRPPPYRIPALALTTARAFGPLQRHPNVAFLLALPAAALVYPFVLLSRIDYLASLDRHAVVSIYPVTGRPRRPPRVFLLLALWALVVPVIWLALTVAAAVVARLVGTPITLTTAYLIVAVMVVAALLETAGPMVGEYFLTSYRRQQATLTRLKADLAPDPHAVWQVDQFAAWPRESAKHHGRRLLDNLIPHLPADVHLVLVARNEPPLPSKEPRDLREAYARRGFQIWPADNPESRAMWRPATDPSPTDPSLVQP